MDNLRYNQKRFFVADGFKDDSGVRTIPIVPQIATYAASFGSRFEVRDLVVNNTITEDHTAIILQDERSLSPERMLVVDQSGEALRTQGPRGEIVTFWSRARAENFLQEIGMSSGQVFSFITAKEYQKTQET